MDGFHLANSELTRLQLQQRKGAPETFDVGGYLALLERIAACDEDIVYAPEYRRSIEEPVAGSVAVPSSLPLVVTEGNYLLLDQGPWANARTLLDEVWFVDVDEDIRRSLLISRHVRFGKTPEAARAWALGTDERNAQLVAATRHRANLVVPLDLRALTRT
jgi:pantothenate kinase